MSRAGLSSLLGAGIARGAKLRIINFENGAQNLRFRRFLPTCAVHDFVEIARQKENAAILRSVGTERNFEPSERAWWPDAD